MAADPLPDQSVRVPAPVEGLWRCALGHEMKTADWMGDDCPFRDREDGSWCGAPMNCVRPVPVDRCGASDENGETP